ncbi:MAG: hypothetical protein JW910_20025 [Anaerolineae bacterium]|nr:hypothetical protein [Anaerolineae bacterium]
MQNTSPSAPRRHITDIYPLYRVALAITVVIVILISGSYVVDVVWGNYHYEEHPSYGAFRGVCYWVGDTRTLERIALYGYTDYQYDLSNRHISNLPDRSWWPVFPLLTSAMIDLTGDGTCSNWRVNTIAVLLLVAVLPPLLGTRRLLPLIGLMFVPFAMWMYVGMAEGVFLLVSALLWIVCQQSRPDARRRNLLSGFASLLLGVLVGLTKPNSIALLPAFLVIGLMQSRDYLRAADGPLPWRARLFRFFSDGNPGWSGILATVGIALGNGIWFYQTSGFYPFYILLMQRTLWFKEFYSGDLTSLFHYFAGGLQQVIDGSLDVLGLERLMRLSAPVMISVLALQNLPPRWPGSAPRPLFERNNYSELAGRVSLLAILGIVLFGGQIHAITRYAMGNIFFIVFYLRYVYGTEDDPPLWQLPMIVLRRRSGSFRAVLRLLMLVLGPALTWMVMVIGPQLGI